jgi:isoleucyl-tRNA synthetase
MHKSLGNAVSPDEVIRDYGADLLRLWVSSSDYRADVRISKEILKQLSDIYLKIRNTARYILGNLSDFDPDALVPFEEMQDLDKWALIRFNKLVERVRAAYERYEFHTIYHGVHNFCAVEMSSFYLDIIKDRLYCDASGSRSRKSAQSAIFIILDGLVRMIAPILAFTSEEIWAAMPHRGTDDAASVLFNQIPKSNPDYDFAPGQEERWNKLLSLRGDVNKALEMARAERSWANRWTPKSRCRSEIRRKRFCFHERRRFRTSVYRLKSQCTLWRRDGYQGEEFPGVTVDVISCDAPKCARCWTHDKDVGASSAHPELCPRCYLSNNMIRIGRLMPPCFSMTGGIPCCTSFLPF